MLIETTYTLAAFLFDILEYQIFFDLGGSEDGYDAVMEQVGEYLNERHLEEVSKVIAQWMNDRNACSYDDEIGRTYVILTVGIKVKA